jgi:TolA-binding protein
VLINAQTSLLQRNYQNAEAELIYLIKDYPNSPFVAPAKILLAFIAFEQEKYSEAQQLFAEAKSTSDSEYFKRKDSEYWFISQQATYWRAVSYALQGKYKDAQPIFEQCYRAYPDGEYPDDALFALGLISEISRDFEIAVNYFRTASTKYPYSNVFICSKIREANNNLILRRPAPALISLENAEKVYWQIVTNDSIAVLYQQQSYAENAAEEIIYLKGESYNLAGKYTQAYSTFQSFLGSYAKSKLTNYARLGAGWALMKMGDHEKSLPFFDDVIKDLSGEYSQMKSLAQLYRANALRKMGDTKTAQNELLELSVQPAYPYLGVVLLELGQIYYENENYEMAQKTLERAERESSDANTTVRVNILLGATYLEQRKWANAINEYKNAEHLALKSSDIFMPNKQNYLAEARLKQGIAMVKSQRHAEAIPPLLTFIGEHKNDARTDRALFWLAEAYYRSDLLNNAVDTYTKIIEKYPKSEKREESLYGLGWSYFRLKNFTKSSSTFNKLVADYPESNYNVEVLARQADGYYITKNYNEASKYYRRAADLAPNTEEGQYCSYQLCHALYRANRYEEAITSLLSFVRSYNMSSYAPNALYLIGWIRFQQGKYNEAISDFRFLIQAYPQSGLVPIAHYAIGDAYYNNGDFESALKAYSTVVESYPNNALAPEAIKSMQYCYSALGMDDEAMQVAEKYVQTNPDSPYAEDFMFKKPQMFYSGRNYQDAVREFESFIEKYPTSGKNAEALFWMGKSYISLNESDKAIQTFNKIQEEYPESDYASLSILETGLMKLNQNQISEADSIFQYLQVKYPANQSAAQAGFERALIKYSMGDTLDAITIFREVEKNYPGMDYANQSIYRIAMHYRLKGMFDSSLDEFKKLKLVENNPELAAEAYFRIGELNMRLERYEKAAESFDTVKDRFVGFEDWYSLSLLYLGECKEKLGETDAAIAVYQTLIEINPENDFGKTAKSRLKRLKTN